ncbi:MEKHLA domain-containing protein [Micromonospora sp. NPDC048898]|uniref:MEKHLA domain-containing protein n=1 Tax=Micromonospora sp. NPDC048898 TaxID=3364260 RepID=UPI003713E5B2
MTGAPDAQLAGQLVDSYAKLAGRDLVPDGVQGLEAARWLHEAPFALLVHDTSPDPLFIYANATAQKVFGYGADEFIGLPSRLSAGEQDRDARARFMASVLRDGYADGYRGPRVRKDGWQFWIEDATIWNVLDAGAAIVGQAALLRRWKSASTV